MSISPPIGATPGTYLFEPPGEIHTLYSDSADEVMILFIISGGLTFFDENDQLCGFMDVFTKIEAWWQHYEKVGLGQTFVEQFIH